VPAGAAPTPPPVPAVSGSALAGAAAAPADLDSDHVASIPDDGGEPPSAAPIAERARARRPVPTPPAPARPAVAAPAFAAADSKPEATAPFPPFLEQLEDAASRPSGNVESLFARIRADREQAVSHAHEVLAEDQPPDDRPVPNGDEGLLQRRDEIVGPIEASLTRRLKRALQDDQNDLLDRLRGLRSSQKAAAVVLSDREIQAARFRDVGRPFLSEALTAGAEFTASLLPGVGTSANLGDLDRAAEDLSEAIVDPLRRRLHSVLVAGQGDDPVVLAEAVGAAYREWKTKRVEVVAADHVAAAFAAAAYAATPSGVALRWLVDDPDGPCPDCDDNVLAGGQPKGEPFPTGQRHPPAHPGCRCLLVPPLR